MSYMDLFAAFRDLFVNINDFFVIFDLTNGININSHLLLSINSTPWVKVEGAWPRDYLLT